MKAFVSLGVTLLLFSFFASPTQALPYYVGDNPTPENRVILGVKDGFTRLEKDAERGNFADLNITGQWRFLPNITATADLPFYVNSKPASGDDYAAGIGNASLKGNWNAPLLGKDSELRLGYFVQGEAYLPTNRSGDSVAYTRAYAPTELYNFSPFTTTLAPGIGIFASQNRWSAKTNLVYGLHHISNDNFAAGNEIRNTFKYQLAGSYHPTANLNISMEYNMIALDNGFAGELGNWRHSVAPSVSGDYRRFVGSLYSVIPIDGDSRELSSFLVGAELGYNF